MVPRLPLQCSMNMSPLWTMSAALAICLLLIVHSLWSAAHASLTKHGVLCQTHAQVSSTKCTAQKTVTTMLTYPWKCTVLHCNHLGNTWKPLVLMIWHFDYCPSASECDNQSIRSSAPVVARCFPGGYNVKLYISRGRLAWWLLAFLHRMVHGWCLLWGRSCL